MNTSINERTPEPHQVLWCMLQTNQSSKIKTQFQNEKTADYQWRSFKDWRGRSRSTLGPRNISSQGVGMNFKSEGWPVRTTGQPQIRSRLCAWQDHKMCHSKRCSNMDEIFHRVPLRLLLNNPDIHFTNPKSTYFSWASLGHKKMMLPQSSNILKTRCLEGPQSTQLQIQD